MEVGLGFKKGWASAQLSPTPRMHLLGYPTKRQGRPLRHPEDSRAGSQFRPKLKGQGERVSLEPGESQTRRRNRRAGGGHRGPPDRHNQGAPPAPGVCPNRLVKVSEIS